MADQSNQSEQSKQTKRLAELIDLADARLLDGDKSGPVASRETEDLDVNVVRLPAGRSIEEHVNREVDVVMVVLAGDGVVLVDGDEHEVGERKLLIIPKGSRRAIRSTGDDALLYLSLHRRRARLWPTVKRSPRSSE